MKYKNILATTACLLSLGFTNTNCYANNLDLIIDGESIAIDTAPIIINNRALVPVRAICENIGVDVMWNSVTEMITFSNDETVVNISIGDTVYTKGDSAYSLDVAPQIINGRTLVPVRFVAENFGCHVYWNSSNGSIEVTSQFNIANGELVINEKLQETEKDMLFWNSRLYLNTKEVARLFNYDLITLLSSPNIKFEQVFYKGDLYFSVNDIVNILDIWVAFKENGVMFFTDYELILGNENEILANTNEEMACLRLEDIMAEPTEDSIYNHNGLEKFRCMASWLNARNQKYSIAWIPLYVNPELGIENDLLTNFNFYNADFIYTLDYLVDNGANIGIHGLTHQSGDEISAVGDEFGENTIFSNAEIEERMLRALHISDTLGYDAKFFEFPHYAVTEEQLIIAEKIYNVIYQQSPKNYGNIDFITRNNNTTMYIPTPSDYIRSAYDVENSLETIRNTTDEHLTSLFFHPHMDWKNISCYNSEDGKRIIKYEDTSIISSIYNIINEKGMSFKFPWDK